MSIPVLTVKQPWIDKLLDGSKIYEIRSSNTKKTNTMIYLAQSGTSYLVGSIIIKEVIGPITEERFVEDRPFHCATGTTLPYKKTYYWVMEHPVRFPTPIFFKRPQGAIIWTKYEPTAVETTVHDSLDKDMLSE